MRITERTLRETERLLRLRDGLGLDADDETVLALAERARSKGTYPAGLFRWLLRHPESWDWPNEKDRALGRKRLEEYLRRQARPATGRRTRMDSRALALKRPHRLFQPPPPSTGWEAEAAEIAHRHDESLTRRTRRERWGQVFNWAVLAGVLIWLFL